jgi:ATP-dependent helicase HrpB
MSPALPALPIDAVLPALRDALARGTSAVLLAPPGTGKTTRVPLALLSDPWLAGQRIVLLEPRRLAARAAARHMAALVGGTPGGLVGYRIRHESVVGPETRVEVVTEGVLTRMLQSDPSLEGVGLVIFDEFHERSIHADLGLALALHSRALIREDLRILVMSATLEGGPVAALLGGAPILTGEGRAFPVELRYRPRRRAERVEAQVAAVVREAVESGPGDVLVFLPGAGEIRRTLGLLEGTVSAGLVPLHANLTGEEQDRAIRPSPPGRRKVVLATSIAETSLTIEGVRIVVDSGLSRVPRYSPRVGLTRLVTVRVSRSSADQRQGRAGRLAPGVCYRLWSPEEEVGFLSKGVPEILESDLAPLALELAAAGIRDPSDLALLDLPPAGALSEAHSLLEQLGALDSLGRITRHGRALVRLSLAPRLAHMVLRGGELGAGSTACELAALLTERDVLRPGVGVPDADMRVRLDLLRGVITRSDHDRHALRRARVEAGACRRARGSRADDGGGPSVGVLLALAYPDRVAQRRPGSGTAGRFLLRNGLGARLADQGLAREEYLVAAELDGKLPESGILRAAPISLEEIRSAFARDISREALVEWDAGSRAVTACRRERLGAMVLRESPLRDPDPGLVTKALLAGIRREPLESLPWSDMSRSIRRRVEFLRRLDAAWPDLSEAELNRDLEAWLGPYLVGMRRLEDLVRVDWTSALLARLTWEQRSALERLAPTHVAVPSGSRVPVDYADPDAPVLRVRLQEMFGLEETPSLADGTVPLTLHLLSPAGRPVQVTRDLAGFWRMTYFEVRRDLKGRYPRHHWPDDPLKASATSRTRPRK